MFSKEKAMIIVEKIKETRLQAILISNELQEINYDLSIIKAQIERKLIKKMGGEKKLAPTEEARERIFVLARNADEKYVELYKKSISKKTMLEETKVEIKFLQDKLNIILAVMKNNDSHD